VTAQVNIRSGPGTAYDIVDTLKRGDTIQVVTSTSNGWKKIGEGRYLTSDFVSKTPTSTPLSGTYYAIGEVNVRSGPGTEYSITRELAKGSAIDVVAITANGWYQTVKNTYVLASLCSKDKPATPTPKPTAPPTPTPKPIPTGAAEMAETVGLSVEDFELMAGIVESERPSGGGNYDGQVWVAQVIWNRVNNSAWPNTVYGVITQSGQFSTWKGGYKTTLSAADDSRRAVVEAFQNPPIPTNVIFFNNNRNWDGTWVYYGESGGNYFYKNIRVT
jgi:spore germination cell wall hydrolase CwlJ-like protein